MTQTIAIDFDGVIHSYEDGWKDGSIYGTPVPGAFDFINKMRQRYAIVIFTTRDSNQVADWLRKRGLDGITCIWKPPFWNSLEQILVTNIKPSAVVYIDDRAVRFTNWGYTQELLARLGIT